MRRMHDELVIFMGKFHQADVILSVQFIIKPVGKYFLKSTFRSIDLC